MGRIIIFGDSITWGASDHEKGGWANRLHAYLLQDPEYSFSVYSLGISGDTSVGVLDRFDKEIVSRLEKDRKVDSIVFAIGTNDSQYIETKDNPKISLQDFKSNIQLLADGAKKYTDKIFFLGLSIVDESKTMPIPWSPTKYYDNENMEAYNLTVEEVCNNQNVKFIDIQDLLTEENFTDGLHPNAEGHEKIFQKVKLALKL